MTHELAAEQILFYVTVFCITALCLAVFFGKTKTNDK